MYLWIPQVAHLSWLRSLSADSLNEWVLLLLPLFFSTFFLVAMRAAKLNASKNIQFKHSYPHRMRKALTRCITVYSAHKLLVPVTINNHVRVLAGKSKVHCHLLWWWCISLIQQGMHKDITILREIFSFVTGSLLSELQRRYLINLKTG